MRPINRGEHPKNEDGSDFIPVKYQAYRGYLIDRIGAYCSYCERTMSHSIAVEHIQPKSLYDELEMDWSNLLLSCTNCNSIKSSKDIIVTNYFWPNLDNTARAFIYHFPTEDSFLKECEGLSPMSRWEMNVGWQ